MTGGLNYNKWLPGFPGLAAADANCVEMQVRDQYSCILFIIEYGRVIEETQKKFNIASTNVCGYIV